eukprot:3298006-Rhodomonas_salina.3
MALASTCVCPLNSLSLCLTPQTTSATHRSIPVHALTSTRGHLCQLSARTSTYSTCVNFQRARPLGAVDRTSLPRGSSSLLYRPLPGNLPDLPTHTVGTSPCRATHSLRNVRTPYTTSGVQWGARYRDAISAYAVATGCPVLTWRMVLPETFDQEPAPPHLAPHQLLSEQTQVDLPNPLLCDARNCAMH